MYKNKNYRFQFQSGAVKSKMLESFKKVEKRFQFQSGAVKSCVAGCVLFFAAYFNSKVVRLKGLYRIVELPSA